METIRNHFEINVFGLLNVTRAFLPLLGAQENHPVAPGKIINVSSVAGKIGFPFLGAYAGSKFAVEGLSHSLRRELQLFGIDVIIVGPGNVITPIWEKGTRDEYADSSFHTFYKNFVNYSLSEAKKGLTIEEIGSTIVAIFEKEKNATRYPIVKGRFQNWLVPRLLPDRMLDKAIKKLMHE